METEALEAQHARLAAKYPRWHFWRDRSELGPGTGALCATRLDHITDDLVEQGLARTLPTDKNLDLEQQLVEQDRIERELYSQPALA